MKNISRFAVWTAVLPLLLSCNLWRPFTSAHSDEDYIEEAQRCLHNNDFACASENYGKLSNTELRLEKLCAVNLAGAGFTITNLVNTVSTDSDHVLGNLAEATLPWSDAKRAFADAAKDNCAQYQTAVAGLTPQKRDLGILLRTLSLFMHCANLIAKTDQVVTHDGTACDKPGNGDGQIASADVAAAADGSVSGASPGMCSADVLACQADVTAIPSGQLAGSNLGDLLTAFNELPDDLKNGAGAQIIRAALRSVIGN